MIDTDFEKDSRAHLFWQEWQKAADKAGDVDTYLDDLIAKASPQWKGVDVDEFIDMVRGREPETITEHLVSVSEDWTVVLDTSQPSNHSGDLSIDLTVSKKDLENIAKTSPPWGHYL